MILLSRMTFGDAVLKWYCQFDQDDDPFFSRKDNDVGPLNAACNFWWKNERGFTQAKEKFPIISVEEKTT